MVVDKRVRGEIVFSPCGLNDKGEVTEADIVLGDDLFHVSKGIDGSHCDNCIWDFMEWLQQNLIKDAMRIASERAIEHHREGSVLWNERSRELRSLLGDMKVPLWMTTINKDGNHQLMTAIHVYPQLVNSILSDRYDEPVTIKFHKTPTMAKAWLEEEAIKRKEPVRRVCVNCKYYKTRCEELPCRKCGSGLPYWEVAE